MTSQTNLNSEAELLAQIDRQCELICELLAKNEALRMRLSLVQQNEKGHPIGLLNKTLTTAD